MIKDRGLQDVEESTSTGEAQASEQIHTSRRIWTGCVGAILSSDSEGSGSLRWEMGFAGLKNKSKVQDQSRRILAFGRLCFVSCCLIPRLSGEKSIFLLNDMRIG